MRLFFSAAKGEFKAAIKEIEKPMAAAGTAAIREAGQIAVRDGRANIASAGFRSARWQKLDHRVSPKRGASLNASTTIFHRLGFAGVFEYGATIKGQPLIWLPLPTVPQDGRGRRMRPKAVAQRYGGLASVNRRGRKPLLVGKVEPTGKSIPLFVGVKSVTLRKRFRITEIVQRTAGRVGELYLKHIRNAG